MNNNNIIDVNENDFENKVINASDKKLIVVDFWAPWCGPCKEFKPEYEKLSESFKDCIFLSIDIDKNQDISELYKIQSIPHIKFFKGGKIIDEMSGSDKISFIHKLSNLNSDIKEPLAFNS